MHDECRLKDVRFKCAGRMVGNLCIEHEVLFDIWGCNGGYEIYEDEGRDIGRKKFKKWLEGLSDDALEAARLHG